MELTTPVTDIINTCLIEGVYPQLWKQEYITPVPKVTHPKTVKELRKISSTSDYSKVFESFIKDWIIQDITPNIDIGQFGGQKGMGTEHMLVCLVDRILSLLDNNAEPTAVIAAMIDWASAFDRQDPTLAIQKFLKMGVRPSLIHILISYLTERNMRVKFNGKLQKNSIWLVEVLRELFLVYWSILFKAMIMLTVLTNRTGSNMWMTSRF